MLSLKKRWRASAGPRLRGISGIEEAAIIFPDESLPRDDDDAQQTAGESAPPYFMDSKHEGKRLEIKTDPYVVGEQLLATGLRHDLTALDLACGSGAVTRVMAKIAGDDLVTGVDISADRLEQATQLALQERLKIRFVQGAVEHLPFPDAAFEYTHARFLFEYLSNPQEALAEMIRVTRPGGTVVVVDLDNQLTQMHPMSEGLRQDIKEALRLLNEQGFDPQVGRKLFPMFIAAGLQHTRVQVAPYQVYTGHLPERDQENWRLKLATATAYLTRLTHDQQRWNQFHDTYLAHLMAPGAFYYSTIMLVTGTTPQ